MHRIFAILVAAVLLSGCANQLAGIETIFDFRTPQQTVFAAKSTYAAALIPAVRYESLPRCVDPPVVIVCSDPEFVQVLRTSDNVAFAALDAAETAVRTPGFSDSVYSAVAASALAAVKAFKSITDALK